jgi:predicted transcriptional regulator
MARRVSAQPTEVELKILHALWEHGSSTIGQIHESLAEQRHASYSSTRKMVQVMAEKGLVSVDDSVRPQLYRAARSREKTQLKMLDELVQRAFGGSTQKLVLSLLSADRLSPEELREVQRLVKKAKGKKQ